MSHPMLLAFLAGVVVTAAIDLAIGGIYHFKDARWARREAAARGADVKPVRRRHGA